MPPSESVRDFWLELIHTLRGQREELQGSCDRMQRWQETFRLLWREGPFFSETSGVIRWPVESKPKCKLLFFDNGKLYMGECFIA